MLVTSIFSFSHDVFCSVKDILHVCPLNFLQLTICKCLNPFPNKLCFLHVCSTSLLKTLWEKEKLLLTEISPIAHGVFNLSGELSAIAIKFEILVCKLFPIWKRLKFVIWERVKFEQGNNFVFQ